MEAARVQLLRALQQRELSFGAYNDARLRLLRGLLIRTQLGRALLFIEWEKGYRTCEQLRSEETVD